MVSEFDLIRRYFTRPTPQTILGPGDDCALIAPAPGTVLAITTDMLVAGTHFFADTDPEALGWKCLAVNLSDLAAMGATPRWVTLAGSLPTADESWVAAFAKGLFTCADEFTVDLIGGDTTRGPLALSITAIGELPAEQALTRSGAQAGDELWISGRPGRAALGLAQLQGRLTMPPGVAADCLTALHRPQPRVALGLALRGVASAAIDVSDGLLGDLGHILERSQVGGEVRIGALPPLPPGVDEEAALDALLAGGDDYELLFAAPASASPAIAGIAARLALPLTRIGRIIDAPAGVLNVLDADNRPFEPARRGYDHFR